MKYLKNRIIQYLVKNLLVSITEEDIIVMTTRGWIKGKRKLSDEEVQFLKEEAKSIKESILWKYMNDEVKWNAQLRMFEKGVTEENTRFGRAMLHNLELLNKFLDNVIKL